MRPVRFLHPLEFLVVGVISRRLFAKLQAHYPRGTWRVGPGARQPATESHYQAQDPVVIFPAIHDDIGDVEIFDEGIELTLYLGRFTHTHFSPVNYNRPVARYADELVEQIVRFLDRLFADQVEFWSRGRAGGWHMRGTQSFAGLGAKRYVWSGPLP